jgi:hypothetical protein
MDKAKIAESVLSSVMEPAQAAIVTGDLLETGASRSACWFWLNVFQTWAATVWHGFRTRPRIVLGLAVRGALWQYGFSLFVGFAYAFAIAFACLMVSLAHPHLIHEFRNGTLFAVHPACAAPFDLFFFLVAPFYAGRRIARQSFGLDIPVCITMAIAYLCICLVVAALSLWLSSFTGHPPARRSDFLVLAPLSPLLLWASSLAGAMLVRRRSETAGNA